MTLIISMTMMSVHGSGVHSHSSPL